MPPVALVQAPLGVDRIKQYRGLQTASRRVKVTVPGKFFPGLQPNERAMGYDCEAVEYSERHDFPRHLKAWGEKHRGPGIRMACVSDAIDDPNNAGFWTTLWLFNRWRHETYKDNREAELQYLDELPEVVAPVVEAVAEKEQPPIKKYFDLVGEGNHTYGGKGKLAGKNAKCYFYACRRADCLRGNLKPIKQVASGTGQLFIHLDSCQPAIAQKLRASSKHSPVMLDEETGEMYQIFSFQELLPHHAVFVKKCFLGLDHFVETRAGNGLLEYVQGFERRAALPHRETCMKLLDVYEELMDERIMKLADHHARRYGTPNCGTQSDLWSTKSCKLTFGCLRSSWVFDGEMVADVLEMPELRGTIVDCSPILSFELFQESRHTGANLARWKSRVGGIWKLGVSWG